MKNLLPVLALGLLSAVLSAQSNTNEKAPKASSTLEFAEGGTLTVSYKSFTLAEGKTLKTLMDKENPRAERMREFYNNQYLPQMLHGHLELGAGMTLGSVALEKGKYRFTFRIDKAANWSFVIYDAEMKKEIGAVAMPLEQGEYAVSSRLLIVPLAASKGQAGTLHVHFGNLVGNIPFRAGTVAEAGAEKNAKGEHADK
ncbi:MAG: hypothetical protein IT458_05170 [Planctomycetes bacterium]|nr:hypothetical protein [Planctomycetota bacterium]